ncbi:MAG: DUF3788 domain-containing protein [Chloroflexi bacterium]|nr:DUF3788 domain-containing protein [Chloroflexota bacterium]
MTVGSFVDKAHQPSMEEVVEALGESHEAWWQLIQHIREGYRVTEEFKFYGKKLGWALRFRKGGQALLSLYPGPGNFTAQIVLAASQAETALSLPLAEGTKGAIAEAYPYPEGRWVFLVVKSMNELEDIKRLLAVKTPARQKRAAPA